MCHIADMRKSLAIFLLSLAPCLLANDSGTKIVFGDDDRQLLNSHDYPYSTLVRIEHSDGHCTGSLVARYVVLTNAHCLINENGHRYSNVRIKLHGLNGMQASAGTEESFLGTTNYPDEPRNDWALIRIDRPYGDAFGTLKVMQESVVADGLTLVGYSGDVQNGTLATIHTGCSIKTILKAYALLGHDCDMTRGASGAAIWRMNEKGEAIVFGLNSAQNSKKDWHQLWNGQDTNLAVATQNFYQAMTDFVAESKTDYETALMVCNNKDKNLKLAFGFKNDELAVSKGWQRIPSKQCREVKLPRAVKESELNIKLYGHAEGKDLTGVHYRDFCIGGKLFGFEKELSDCSDKKIFAELGELKAKTINRINLN